MWHRVFHCANFKIHFGTNWGFLLFLLIGSFIELGFTVNTNTRVYTPRHQTHIEREIDTHIRGCENGATATFCSHVSSMMLICVWRERESVCVCVCVRVFVCVSICVEHVCIYVHTHAHTHTHIYTHGHAHARKHTQKHTQAIHTRTCTHTQTHTKTHTSTCINILIYMYICDSSMMPICVE